MKNSELILNSDGSIYHLNLFPEEISTQVITAGDPKRIEHIASFLRDIEYEKSNREFLTITGYYKDLRLSLISTGIGTDNIDIVFNELDALWNIDFKERRVKENLSKAKILRLGTTGSLQEDIPTGTLIFSRYGFGADGLMEYYKGRDFLEKEEIEQCYFLFHQENKPLPVYSYFSKSPDSILPFLSKDIIQGITYTAKGFYAPQGRSLGRAQLSIPNLIEKISSFAYNGFRLTNMEMETAGIMGLGAALGHEAASISVALANRKTGEFSKYPSGDVEKMIEIGLDIMYQWSKA